MRISLASFCSLVMIVALLSQPLPTLSENQENKSQILTSCGRSLAEHGGSNRSSHRDTFRVFMRKVRSGGGGGGKKSRHRVPTGGGSGGSSGTSRPCLSIAFHFGCTVASSILLISFAF
ncbi:unnamed protein product [Microthlaspi erraticum]|uniref:Uncharacterized protein n=1 Tax=Microthlaspi erraticum TaxID=1685480 RepID=A0A6D2KA22_9BRAS|nr:unnamed protein product [Microthlaspi erraticum]